MDYNSSKSKFQKQALLAGMLELLHLCTMGEDVETDVTGTNVFLQFRVVCKDLRVNLSLDYK